MTDSHARPIYLSYAKISTSKISTEPQVHSPAGYLPFIAHVQIKTINPVTTSFLLHS